MNFIGTSSSVAFNGDKFTRRIILPLATIMIVAIMVVLAFVVISADGQNRLEVEASTKLAKTALKVKTREVARNLRDYAVWEDVYNNLHLEVDADWASTDGNVGANIFEGLGYEMAFAIDPHKKTVYAVIDGKPQDIDAVNVIPNGLLPLLSQGASV